MTKLWEVSDETSTDRFPHFQCLTLQCDTSTLSLRPGGRVGSPRGRGRLTSEVAVGVGGGGVFPETILDLLVTFQTRPDPRPDPDLGPQLHISFRDNAPSTRPHTGECYRAVLSAFISLYLDAWTDATHTARQYIARTRSHRRPSFCDT